MTPADVPTGYDEEERYFREQEAEQLKQMREKLDVTRQEQAARQAKETHWMKCPKCGADLTEVKMEGVMVDKCGGCEGLFFDSGELELMIAAHKKGLGPLRRMFG